ncbi:hypothetical protein V1280_004567 [Bradyrhizobium sp. AZCC 2230]
MAFQRKKPEALGAKSPLLSFIEPALASSIDRVPSGDRWVHEIKFDGYRVQVHLANEAVKVYTRRGHDWTRRFQKVAADAWHIKASSAVIDGEIVVPAADGTTDLSVLQNELKGTSTKIVLVAFDLLYLNGRDLRKLPLIQRKAELKKIIAGTDVQFSESFEIDGPDLFTHACKVGLEGVVSKVRDSVYPIGRSKDRRFQGAAPDGAGFRHHQYSEREIKTLDAVAGSGEPLRGAVQQLQRVQQGRRRRRLVRARRVASPRMLRRHMGKLDVGPKGERGRDHQRPLRIPHDRAEHRGPRHPSEGYACHPDDTPFSLTDARREASPRRNAR